MAEAITTNAFRRKLALAMYGGDPVSPIAYMAFGDGGHDTETLTAIPPDPDQSALNHEILRKPIAVLEQEDEFSVTGRGVLEKPDAVGYAISEAALVDANGLIIGIKNFAPKVKESDEEYETGVRLRF